MKDHPPVSLRSFPPLSRFAWEGERRQRGGAALAQRPLGWAVPVAAVAANV